MLPFRKSPDEKVEEILKNPTLRHSLEIKQAEEFIEDTDWSDVASYLAYFKVHKIPHMSIKSKVPIEIFAETSKADLEPDEEIFQRIGDGDFVYKDYIVGAENVRQNIRNTVDRCGPGSIKIVMDTSPLKGGQPLVNAKTLLKLGADVRYHEANVRAIVVDKKDRKTMCCWEGFTRRDKYRMGRGEPQQDQAMLYGGYILLGNHDLQMPFLSRINDYSHRLWEEAKPIESVINRIESERTRRQFT